MRLDVVERLEDLDAVKIGRKFGPGQSPIDELEHRADVLERYLNAVNKGKAGISEADMLLVRDPFEATIWKVMEQKNAAARNQVANVLLENAKDFGWKQILSDADAQRLGLKPGEYHSTGTKPSLHDHQLKEHEGIVSRLVADADDPSGTRVERWIVDRDVADAMANMSQKKAGMVTMALNNMFRLAVTTFSPVFTLRNMARDFSNAFVNGKYAKAGGLMKFTKDYARAMGSAIVGTYMPNSASGKELRAAIDAGLGFGFGGTLRQFGKAGKVAFPNRFRKGLRLAKTPFDLLEQLNSAVEMAPRLAELRRAKDAGLSLKDAVIAAKNSTIDFDAGGTFAKVISSFVPFLNARVQGKAVFFRALLERPAETLFKSATVSFWPALAAYALNEHFGGGVLDEIPEDVRKQYHTIALGWDTDKNTGERVPKYLAIPRGEAAILTYPIEAVLRDWKKKYPKEHAELMTQWLHDLVSPVEFMDKGELSGGRALSSLAPPWITSIVGAVVGKDIRTGRDIVPMRGKREGSIVNLQDKKNVPPEGEWTDNTSEVWKWIGEKAGVSPLKWSHIARGFLGEYGSNPPIDPVRFFGGIWDKIVMTRGGGGMERKMNVLKQAREEFAKVQDQVKRLYTAGKTGDAQVVADTWTATRDLFKQKLASVVNDPSALIDFENEFDIKVAPFKEKFADPFQRAVGETQREAIMTKAAPSAEPRPGSKEEFLKRLRARR
jgi:hypothetical protein